MLKLSTYLKSGLTVNNVGFSTVQNLLIGTGTTTGTESQLLQVSGGTYISGNTGIGTTNPISPLDVKGILGIDAGITTIASVSATTIDTLPISTYRSARFQVQITQSTNYQSSDLMIIHNGTNSNIVEYGSVATNDYLASFTSTVSGSDMLLQATMISAGIATVKVVRYGVTV